MESGTIASKFQFVAWIAIASCYPACMAQGGGTVCLVPGGFDDFAKGGATVEAEAAYQHQPAPAGPAEAVRFVQVDGLAPVKVTSLAAGKVTGIPATGRHAMRIAKRADMTRQQAMFRFSFSEYKSNRLCLWYESFYGTWRLQEGAACHCR